MPWDKVVGENKICVHKKGEDTPLHCYPFTAGNERSKALAEKKANKYLAALYVHEKGATDMSGGVPLVTFEQTDGPISFEMQAGEEGDILVFKNAVLARAEVNANRDEITKEGIKELAATIAGRPIDDEHQIEKLVGAFTAGRAIPVTAGMGGPQVGEVNTPHLSEDGLALQVDGFIWADRWPELAEMVKAGKKGLSIEAGAAKATCSICGGEFQGSHDYCEHIFSKRSKVKHNAVRTLHGLKAKGGATTFVPAASSAQFGKEIYMVASHEDINDTEEGLPSAIKGEVKMDPEVTGMTEEEKAKKAAEEAAIVAQKEKDERESLLKAEVEKLTTALDDYKKQLEAAKADLEVANKEKASLEARYVKAVMGSVLDGDELKVALEKAKGMTPDQIDLVASVLPAKPKTPGLRFFSASSGEDNGTPTKDKLTL